MALFASTGYPSEEVRGTLFLQILNINVVIMIIDCIAGYGYDEVCQHWISLQQGPSCFLFKILKINVVIMIIDCITG
jgi:hypothetical protein